MKLQQQQHKINKMKTSKTDNLIDETYNQIQAQQLKEEALVQAEEIMNRRFETELLNFKLKCEKLVSKSYENYNTHLKNLKEQIQNNDKMIENLLHTIKVLTSFKGSQDIAVYEKRDVNDSHSESFNVPLKIMFTTMYPFLMKFTILIVSLKMKCVVMTRQLILY